VGFNEVNMKDNGQIEFSLFPKESSVENNGLYYVGDFKSSCVIDLKDYMMFACNDKEDPHIKKLIFRPKRY